MCELIHVYNLKVENMKYKYTIYLKLIYEGWGNTESRKNLEQKFIFQIGTLNLHGIKQRFSFN